MGTYSIWHPGTIILLGSEPELYISNIGNLQAASPVPSKATSSQRPCKTMRKVTPPHLSATGTGRGHQGYAPMTCRLRFDVSDLPPVSSLVDTGASLSTIDKSLADQLGLQPGGHTLRINGVGSMTTLGYVTVPFHIEGSSTDGERIQLSFKHDFHVLPSFSPGVCLGNDWISGHDVHVACAKRQATLSSYTFPVRADLPHARTLNGEICTRKAVVIPPSCHTWVDVDTAALLEGATYTFEPRLFHHPEAQHAVIATACIMDRTTTRMLVTNFGDAELEMPRRTCLGEATALGAGSEVHKTDIQFTLDASPASPMDPFDFDEQPEAERVRASATAEVDGYWKVGIDDHGRPHQGVIHLLRRHKQAFALDGRPGHIKGAELHIPVEDPAKLRAEAPRRVSPELRAVIEKQVAELLEWDVIEESKSPVSSAVHLVRQRDKIRFCVDYCHVNSATTPDRYPLPRIDDVLETLSGSKWFSSLDAIRGYHQLDVAEQDRWKTAFITHMGLYQYKRFPFGLRSAPAYFQRFMDRLLGPMRWITALVYLDDVVVFTKTLEEHLEALGQLLAAAEHAGLRFSPAKCTFAVRELNLLGRKVSGHGLGVMEGRTAAVLNLPAPTTLQELYHALGLFAYYRQFIPNFNHLCEPLFELTRGWSRQTVGSVSRLKDQQGNLVSAKNAKIAWGHRQRESFEALKRAIGSPSTLAHPDYERPFLLYTDACKTGFAAAVHQVSVLPDNSTATSLPAWPHQPTPVDLADMADALRSDPTFGKVYRRLADGTDAEDDPTYALRDGLLLRRDDGRLCIPKTHLLSMLRRVHDAGGHFGFAKSYLRAVSEFWHPRLSSLLATYIRHCPVCLRTKSGPHTGRLDVTQDAIRPFQHISIDAVLGMPRTARGHDAMLVATDTFSKMVLLAPCTAAFTARDVTFFIMNRIVRCGWRPERLTSDRDLRIMGEASAQLGQLIGMSVTATPPHHHQANPVERQIQTVQRVFKAFAMGSSNAWDQEILPAVELAINSSPSLATGMTPFDAVYIDSPRALDTILARSDPVGIAEWVESFRLAKARLAEARTLVRAEHIRQKQAYDANHAALPDLEAGDEVWVRLRDRPMTSAPSGKLGPLRIGPYRVRRVLSPHRVLLDLPEGTTVGPEFATAQLEKHPGPDPFRREQPDPSRSTLPRPTASRSTPSSTATPHTTELDGPRRGTRTRQEAAILRDPLQVAYGMDAALTSPLLDKRDVFTTPRGRAKRTVLDGAPVLLVERPVAFLSRRTTTAEAKLTGPELEITCIAWAMTRAQHLLQGSEVTVITDHAPVPGMLTSRVGAVPYGPTVERARAILRPRLHRLTFKHKPGRFHTNADALSRLPAPYANRDDRLSDGGACAGGPL